MRRVCFLVVLLLGVCGAASGQTKISGTVKCAKAEKQFAVEAPDQPGHSFGVSQAKCTWSKPMTIEGLKNKEGVDSNHSEATGMNATFRGLFVDTMENGDKAYYRYTGKGTMKKDGTMATAEDSWESTGGTGKLKGIKSKGTCKGKGNADGSVTWECQGEYQIAK